MSRRTRLAFLLLAASALAAGCGSASRQASAPASPAQPPSLATTLVTATGTWAVAVMGGSAAEHNNFWQLFVRPTATGKWRLATPPGVASNGGLVVATPGAGSVVAGFRPSQDLSYSPLAASSAGRSCGLGNLTAAAFSPSGVPLLAGSCARPGTAGIFAYAGGTWHPAGPVLPAMYARQRVTVLRLTTTAGTTMALLAAGSGAATRLLAAWSTGGGGHWGLSPPLPLRGAKLTSASSGPGGSVAVVLTGNHALTVTGPAGSWSPLPTLPPGTVTLAPGPAGGWDALAVHRTRLTVWRLQRGGAAWAAAQTINVPIEFGSSG